MFLKKTKKLPLSLKYLSNEKDEKGNRVVSEKVFHLATLSDNQIALQSFFDAINVLAFDLALAFEESRNKRIIEKNRKIGLTDEEKLLYVDGGKNIEVWFGSTPYPENKFDLMVVNKASEFSAAIMSSLCLFDENENPIHLFDENLSIEQVFSLQTELGGMEILNKRKGVDYWVTTNIIAVLNYGILYDELVGKVTENKEGEEEKK